MTTEERIKQLREWGYSITKGNDAIGSGYVCFSSAVRSGVPSPISFIFIRDLPNGEYKEVSFSMPTHSWKMIITEALQDML